MQQQEAGLTLPGVATVTLNDRFGGLQTAQCCDHKKQLSFIHQIDSSRYHFPSFGEMNIGKEMASLGIKKCVTAKETALGESEQELLSYV